MKVGVVGAGIVGSAVSYELLRRGADVICFDPAGVMNARSQGDTRIFRTTHTSPQLVDAALEAVSDWRRWSEAAGRQLVSRNGVLVTGPSARPYVAAAESRDMWTIVGPRDHPEMPGHIAPPVVLDMAGGIIDMAAVRLFMQLSLGTRLIPVRVESVSKGGGAGFSVSTDGGHKFDVDLLVIAAGEGTAPLASDLGMQVVETIVRHSRFTFDMVKDLPDSPAWIGSDEEWGDGFSFYGHRVGVDRWALGAHIDDKDAGFSLGAEEVERRSAAVVVNYVREKMSLLIPQPVDVINCTHPVLESGDGFTIRWGGTSCVVWGHNLAKFAPYIGRRVAESVLENLQRSDVELGF